MTNLKPKGFDHVFIVGDGAETKYSGMAQTALYDGKYAAKRIAASIKGKDGIIEYAPKAPYYAVPVGYEWAGIVIGNLRAYGKMGWWIRRLADLAVFCSILPLSKALDVFRDGRSICETCSICESAESDRINS